MTSRAEVSGVDQTGSCNFFSAFWKGSYKHMKKKRKINPRMQKNLISAGTSLPLLSGSVSAKALKAASPPEGLDTRAAGTYLKPL